LGNALQILKDIPSESIQCCITSPPYYAMRVYDTPPSIWEGALNCEHNWVEGASGHSCEKCGGWLGQLGLEPTPEMYIQHLCQIFNEVYRVLKKDGVF